MRLFDNLQDEVSNVIKKLLVFSERLEEFREKEKQLEKLLVVLSERVIVLETQVTNIKENQKQLETQVTKINENQKQLEIQITNIKESQKQVVKSILREELAYMFDGIKTREIYIPEPQKLIPVQPLKRKSHNRLPRKTL